MSILHCFCCCFIRHRKGKIRRPLAIKYWDDAGEVSVIPKTPDSKAKRKKRVNLFQGFSNLKFSQRLRHDDDDADDDDDDDDDNNDDGDDDVEILLEEGVKKSSLAYYFNCFGSKTIKNTIKEKKTKKKKKKRKKKIKQLSAENDGDMNNEEQNEIAKVENDEKKDDDNYEVNEDETKTENDNNDDGSSSKMKDPKVDAYKEKKRLRKTMKEQEKLQKIADEEEKAARLAGMKAVIEVDEEYSKYHSVQQFALGTSLLDIVAEQEKFKVETIKWRTYKRKQEKKAKKTDGWEDRTILNSGCPSSFIPSGYIIEESAPPALDLKFINHRKVMFKWYDDNLKPPVHGWFLGIISSAKKHGYNFAIKYDLEITKNKHVNGVIGTQLDFEGENAYGLRWSILRPINAEGDIYSEDLKFTENNGEDA